MASASGRAVGSDDSVLETRLSKEDGGRTFDFNGTRMNNSKQSSSSNTDDGSDSDSSSTNNSTSSIDESSSGDTANSVDDDVSVTPESDDDESEPTGAMAPAATDAVNGLIGSEVGTYVHRVLERPKVMPSDHPNKVHDWSGWPKFPPKAKPDLKRSVIKPTRLPRIIHVNSHEFRPIMELQINIHGRFMQPAPSIQLSHLMDDLQYTVWLTFTDVKDGRCAGQYSHPESPRPGSSWNGKVVSFDQVKLFSDEGYGQQPGPPVTLKIDSTYRVQVNVGAVNDSGHILSSTVFRKFIGHSFIAVSHACRNVPRFIQPAPSFRLTNLMDDLQYTIWLTFTELHGGACGQCQLPHILSRRLSVTGAASESAVVRVLRRAAGQFTHPESPRPGSFWKGKVVSFARLKLFSNDGIIRHPPPITLKSSTTYRIQVNIGVVNDSGHILSATVVRQFVGGIFFAVVQTAKKSS
ncbi:uncharacterized protein LOC119169388 isoform X2 [Rhipicephalus microplus]